MKTITFILAVLIIATSSATGQKSVKFITPDSFSPASLVLQRVVINANNISSYFQNTGIFDQNTTSGYSPGFQWPKGSGRYAMFTAGFSIGCGINGQYAQVMASYKGEYSPGRVRNGLFYTDSTFKIYSVKAGDSAGNNPDYANWYKMVPYGAPFVDLNNNGVYDNGIDKPGIKDAAQTIFELMTDADSTQRSPGEGFGGGIRNPLLKAEIAMTVWAYDSPGLEDIQFLRWRIINKGNKAWDSTFFAIVADPDVGDALDDYVGCDTILNLGYCYNMDNFDGNGSPPTYGAAPPAVGFDFLLRPIMKKANGQNDTLGITSFVIFKGTGSASPPCETDPNGEPIQAYIMLQGLKKDRTSFIDVSQSPYKRTKFCYSGDPETQSGWTESKGSMRNCNGDTSEVVDPVNSGGDRRFALSSGSLDFRVFPNDTQTIVVGQMIARGSNNLNSVTKLKELSRTTQIVFDSMYKSLKIEIPVVIPERYFLFQNYPNPFNPVTNIKFMLPEKSFVTIKVYNILGQNVKTLINNERLDAGTHQTRFSGNGLASGIYFCTIQAEKFTQTKRMVLLK